jgi:hypothetical protein
MPRKPRPRPPRVPLQLNRHELRALICLVGRVRLTPIERTDLADAIPELERALTDATSVHPGLAVPCRRLGCAWCAAVRAAAKRRTPSTCHDKPKHVMTPGSMPKHPTKPKPKPKPQKRTKLKPPVVNRSRGVPVQLYLSDSEKSALKAIARKRSQSISDVIRRWIHGARPKRKRAAVATKADRRQISLFDSGPGSTARAS